MKYVDNSDFESRSREIEQDVENTLQRVIDDYSHHWKGVLGETIQNSFDAWCTNRFDRKVIPEDQQLEIRFEVDLNEREFRASDNSGGMPKETFLHKFAGLDTPGEEKQSGGAGGSYGRGFHVIAGLGESTYAETHHDSFRRGLVVSGPRQMETEAEHSFPQQGTKIEVDGCDVEVLVDLTNRGMVEGYIQQRFQPMLQREDVSIIYDIEGDEQEFEPVDISSFDILWSGDINFEYGGEDRVLEDVVIYDKTSSDVEVPFEGVQMLKRNEHLKNPFMRIHEYKPRQVRHLDKMFGFCDASSLCPKYENNAHNRLTQSAPSASGIKDKLEEIEREHFIGTPTDLEERDELVDTTINVVNNQWENNPFDAEAEAPDDSNIEGLAGELSSDKGDSIDPDEVDDDNSSSNILDGVEEDTENEPTTVDEIEIDWAEGGGEQEEKEPVPSLTCSTRQQRVDIAAEAEVWATVENPAGSSYSEFKIIATLTQPDSDTAEELESFRLEVDPGEGTSGDDSWTVETPLAGTYTVDASLIETGTEEREQLDTSIVEFEAGDPREDESSEGENDSQPVSFLEDITFVRAADEEDFRADLNEGDRGMILVVNSAHPEWKHAVKLDGTTSITNQKLTLIRWANEAIVNRMLLDEIEGELSEYSNDDGEQLSEEMSTFVRETVINQMSEMVAEAHSEVEL